MIKFDKTIAPIALTMLLAACAGPKRVLENQPKTALLETDVAITVAVDKPVVKEQTAVLAATKKYIPQVSGNDEYRVVANPYLALEGAIDKSSIELFIKVRRALKDDQPDIARQHLDQLTQQDARLAGPWVLLADIDRRAGDYALAEQKYRAALGINRKNINAYIGLAKVQRQQGAFLAAQNSYAEALEVWPDFPEAHLNLAILYDQYLNLPLRAQRHMEAYLFLATQADKRVEMWLAEIQRRTGQAIVLKGKAKPAVNNDIAGLE